MKQIAIALIAFSLALSAPAQGQDTRQLIITRAARSRPVLRPPRTSRGRCASSLYSKRLRQCALTERRCHSKPAHALRGTRTRPGRSSSSPGASDAFSCGVAALKRSDRAMLFGDVWARPGLSQRDRSLVTVSALISMNRPDQLRSHMARARDNGVTQEELVETITHLAFYAGWPSAVTAVGVAKEVFKGNPRP
jgi:alkylhydroperoxidase/carboxymuconolactone decarboxylase family protein YurZ